jgi:sugar/nucleoside kinase (ribokinase family)
MRTIVCLGHAALDRIYSVPHMPVGSTKVRATSYTEVGGGMASNAACAIARLLDPSTHRVEFWGRTGGDSAGAIIRADLVRYGVDTSHLHTFAGCASSQSAVMVDPDGDRMIVNYRGDTPTDDMSWLPFERIAGIAGALTDVRWLEGARGAALRRARRPCTRGARCRSRRRPDRPRAGAAGRARDLLRAGPFQLGRSRRRRSGVAGGDRRGRKNRRRHAREKKA